MLTWEETLMFEHRDRTVARRCAADRLQRTVAALSDDARTLLLTAESRPRAIVVRPLPFLAASELIRLGCIADEGRLTGHGVAVFKHLVAGVDAGEVAA